VRLETNKAPLRARVLNAALGFWSHLLNEREGSLVSDAYQALRADSFTTNSPTTNWCCQLKDMLAATEYGYIWDLGSSAALSAKHNAIIRKIETIDRAADITSAQNSSSIPHYFDLLRGTSGPAPYLTAKLPCYLATCVATIRLSYDQFHFSGAWYKLGATEGVPCRMCGGKATFFYIFNDCPGLTQARLSSFDNMQPAFDIHRTLSLAADDPLG